MNRSLALWVCIGYLSLLATIGAYAQEQEQVRLPVTITANAGQWRQEVKYASLFRGNCVAFYREGLQIVTPGRSVSTSIPAAESPKVPRSGLQTSHAVTFHRPSKRMHLVSGGALAGVSNFYRGNDTTRWYAGVHNHASVTYRDVWQGIDVECSVTDTSVRQRIAVLPGANLRDIAFRIDADPELDTRMLLRDAAGRESMHQVSRDGIIRPFTYDSLAIDTTILESEFSRYIGGIGDDGIAGLATDRDGNIYVLAVTLSPDFPLRNPFQQMKPGDRDYALMRLGCDGKTLLYSTYFGGSKAEVPFLSAGMNLSDSATMGPLAIYFYIHNTNHVLAVSEQNGHAYVRGISMSRDLPMTSRSVRYPVVQPDTMLFLAGFDDTGGLHASGYYAQLRYRDTARCEGWWCGYNNIPHSLVVDKVGNPTIVGMTADPIPFITPTAVQGSFPDSAGSEGRVWVGYVVKFAPRLDTVLAGTYWYATPGARRGGYNHLAAVLAFDSNNHLVLSGFTDGTDWPLVNAFQTMGTPSRNEFMAVAKLDADFSSCIFSTYYAGDSVDVIVKILLDDNDNIILVGGTTSSVLPLAAPIARCPADSSRGSIFIGKLGPDGQPRGGACIRSQINRYFAYDPYNFLQDAGIAAGGPIMLSIYAWDDAPVLVPRMHPRGSAIRRNLVVIDPQDYEVLTSSPLIHIPDSLHTTFYFNWHPSTFTPNGYYLAARHIPSRLFHSPDTLPHGGLDICLARIYAMYVHRRDTLRLHVDTTYTPHHRFVHRVTVTNRGANPITGMSLQLTLPRGIGFDPPGQSNPRIISGVTLAPGASWVFTTTLAITDAFVPDTTAEIRARCEYTYGRQLSACAENFIELQTTRLFVTYSDSPEPEVVCTVGAPGALTRDPSGGGYLPASFPVQLLAQNVSRRPREVAQITLEHSDTGLRVQPRSDTTQSGRSLAPGDTLTAHWLASAAPAAWDRYVPVRVALTDEAGNLVTRCLTQVFAPGLPSLRCMERSEGWMTFRAGPDVYQPDTVALALRVRNPLDTARTVRSVTAVLAAAPHLRLRAGDTGTRGPLPLMRGGVLTLPWTFEAGAPPVQSTTDTVVFRYVVDPGGYVDSCLALVHITREEVTLACTLRAPDSLALDAAGTQYTGMPGTITAQVDNSDARASSALTLTLEVDPADALTVLDPLLRPLAAIAARGRDSVRWRWTAPALQHARTVRLLVRVRDTAGVQQSSCEHVLFIPGMTGDLACTLTAPDSIAYDVAGDVHVPDPFTVQVALENRLDTLRPLVETEIDLTHAPHLALAAGESVRRTLTDIPARGQASADYRLTVRRPLTSPVRDTVLVRTRAVGDSTWQACAHPVFIDGRERIVSVSCATRGQDTLWGDPYYETVIPLPLQVEYALTNTGNAPLRSCAVAILPPPMYVLAGSDSVQQYGEIAPGATVRRDWLLTLDPAQAVPGTAAIAFVPQCAELAVPPVCTRPVTLAVGAPEGIVLTPWRLHFAAEQGGALPAAQQVTLWTGNGASIFWQAVPDAGWLRAEPGLGSVKTVMDVQPTTTALAAGMHEGTVTVSAGRYVRPHRIEATYTLTTIVSVAEPVLPRAVELGPAYPNPATGEVRIDILLDAPRAVLLELYDLYGRRVARLHEGLLTTGRHTIRWSAAGRLSGLYLHVLRTDRGTLTRSVVVRR
jgi:hypothetical protein